MISANSSSIFFHDTLPLIVNGCEILISTWPHNFEHIALLCYIACYFSGSIYHFQFQPWSIQRLKYLGTTVILCTALTFNTSQELFCDWPPVERISRSGLGLNKIKPSVHSIYKIMNWPNWKCECGDLVDFFQQFNDVVVCWTSLQLWNISIGKDGKSETEFLATLSRHTRAVNVVRFSPDGCTEYTRDTVTPL